MSDSRTLIRQRKNDVDFIEEQLILSALVFGNIPYSEIHPPLKKTLFKEQEHQVTFEWVKQKKASTNYSENEAEFQYFLLSVYGYESNYSNNLFTELHIVYLKDSRNYSLELLNKLSLNLSIKREGVNFLNSALEEIRNTKLEDVESTLQTINRLQNKTSLLTENWSGREEFFTSVKSGIEELEKLAESLKTQSISTPFQNLNELLNGGFKPGELIIIGARPSIGKTTLACNLCFHFANQELKDSGQILFWTLEDSKAMISAKLISMFLKDNFFKPVNSWTKNNLPKAKKFVANMPIKFAISPIFIEEFCSKVKTIRARFPFKVIIIDYVNKIRSDTNRNTRAEEVAAIASSLRELANSMQSPVILLAQINRNSDNRIIRLPQLHDLKESGALEESADTVLLLHREYHSLTCNPPQSREPAKLQEYRDNLTREKNKAKIIVAKNKFNQTGSIDLYFYPENIGFSEKEKL